MLCCNLNGQFIFIDDNKYLTPMQLSLQYFLVPSQLSLQYLALAQAGAIFEIGTGTGHHLSMKNPGCRGGALLGLIQATTL